MYNGSWIVYNSNCLSNSNNYGSNKVIANGGSSFDLLNLGFFIELI